MAQKQNDLLKRYLDAGMAFTQMTQQRAEAIVRDLVRAGEVQAEQAQQTTEELFERSRRNTERLLDTVRKEIRSQVNNLGLATKADIARLERRIDSVGGTAKRAAGAKKAARKGGTRKKAAGKKSAAKKSARKRTAAKKSAAKKSSRG